MPAKLATRKLGKDGPEVTALGFGCMGLSAFYGTAPPDEERFQVLDRAYEKGALFWDSADVYGDNEDFIGNWFKRTGKRDEIFIATKFASRGMPDGTRKIDNSPEYIKEACDKSLKRLGIDCIDLYYCHRLNGKVPVEEVVASMAELVKEGKVKYIGLSECSSATLRRACKVHHIAAVEIEYSPFTLDIEDPQIKLLATCRELGVATVAYSPLGRGFLTGGIKSRADFEEGDFRLSVPRFSEENFGKNLKLVDQIKELAARKGCTAGQLTLAWLMAQGNDIIPIPGTKKVKYLDENLGSLDVHLTDAEEKEIRRDIEATETHGERYASALMGACFMDTPEPGSK